MTTSPAFVNELTISFRVKDRKAAAEWYGRVLGFKVLYEVAEIGWCEMATHMPGVSVGFSEVQDVKAGAGPVPVWGVQDIDAARAAMEKQSVRFDGKTRTIPGLVKLATFLDPDGNAWMLSQSLQQS